MEAVKLLEEQMGQSSLQPQDQSSAAFNSRSSNSDDGAEHQQIAPFLSGDDDSELARLIPNPAARQMYLELERKLKSKPRVPQWDGYYHSSNIPRHPFLTNGLAPKPHTGYRIVTSAGSLVLVRMSLIQSKPEEPIKPKVPIKPAVKQAGSRRHGPKKPPSRRAPAESFKSSSSTLHVHESTHVLSFKSIASSSTSQVHSSAHVLSECLYCMSWDPLLVYNPQARDRRERVRELPRPDCSPLVNRMYPPWIYRGFRSDEQDDTPWDYRGFSGGVQAVMVAQTDGYKVILAFEVYVIVYSSATNNWSFFECQRPTPFGWDGKYESTDLASQYVFWSSGLPWAWFAASAIIRGRLYCADVVQESHATFLLRLFEVDYEATQSWKLQGSFTLRKRHWDFLPAQPSTSIGREMDGIRFLELVECMGQICAVIPARIDEYLTTEFTSSRTKEEVLCADVPAGCQILPIQFHILRLQGVDRDHRVLRIVVPKTVDPQSDESRDREELLPEFRSSRPRWMNWFCCGAEGSVIFVAHEQYLLQYDVVSGMSKTGIIQEEMLRPIPNTRYSPNVQLKP